MVPIRSWTTLERVIRTAIFTVIITVFAVLCYKDRFWAYPRDNVASLLRNFPDQQGQSPVPNPDITESTADTLTQGMTVSEVEDRLGPPAFSDDPLPPDHLAKSYYFGEAGMLVIEFDPRRRGKLAGDAVWEPGPHDQMELYFQLAMAIGLTPVALFTLFHLGRVLTTRAELSDAGLKLRGKPLVPFDAMKALDASHYRKKGWVQISYSLGGRDGRVRLDDYVYKEFPAIIGEICARKGFESPLQDSGGDDADHEDADSNAESSNSLGAGNDANS